MTRALRNFALGQWVTGTGTATTLHHAVTGAPVAEASSGGLDFKAMAEAIPGASLVVIRNAGHLAPLERPVETTDAITAFLAGLP